MNNKITRLKADKSLDLICEKNNSSFIVKIDGKKIKTEEDWLYTMAEAFHLPVPIMEFGGDEFVPADKIIKTKTSGRFFKADSRFTIKPGKKYRVDVMIEIYNRKVVISKSEIISNVLAESFDNALTKDEE